MKATLLTAAMMASCMSLVLTSPGSAQLTEGANLWGAGAGGFGAGIGAATVNSFKKNTSSISGKIRGNVDSASAIADKARKGLQDKKKGAKQPVQVSGDAISQARKLEETGNYLEAANSMARFAQQRESAYGAHDPLVLRSYDKAAALANRANKKAEADRFTNSAIDVCKRCYGPVSREVKQRESQLSTAVAPSSPTPAAPASPSTTANPATSAATSPVTDNVSNTASSPPAAAELKANP